jgi:methionyl-tRNA formyltransferase
MNIVFAGTPAFSVAPLAALHAAGHRMLAVYTQPDRPAGRGRELKASPVKEWALAHDIAVHQPASLKSAEEAKHLRQLAPDVMIVIAYGLILPQAILDIPRHGCLNVHASLLPRWRGAAPIQRAIEAGDRETGVTIMQMDAGLDTGDIRLTRTMPISETDTSATLHDRLSALGAEALCAALDQLARGTLARAPQDNAQANYAAKLSKDEARLDWSQPAVVLQRKIRAFNPWPMAFTTVDGAPLRVWESVVDTGAGVPGSVLRAGHDGIAVATGDGVLRLTRVQTEGGKPLAARDFLNGRPLASGARLGT